MAKTKQIDVGHRTFSARAMGEALVAGTDIGSLYRRYRRGDWGTVSTAVARRNDENAKRGRGVLYGRYRLKTGQVVEITTDKSHFGSFAKLTYE